MREDTSGLYVAVCAPEQPKKLDICRENLAEAKRLLEIEQSVVEIFEIGTTKLISRSPVNMQISSFEWSPDCRFVSVSGLKQNCSVRILKTTPKMFEQVLSIFDAVKLDANFWSRFPINLHAINAQE